ncbi:MAG TPA: ribosome assembly RNA-binding protein YhbY [Polyangiaceae bacterium]|nr:ribosome assembly RNA-binding protein YhbY [Polyangiaceae bacterium]
MSESSRTRRAPRTAKAARPRPTPTQNAQRKPGQRKPAQTKSAQTRSPSKSAPTSKKPAAAPRTAAPLELTGAQRRFLRAMAHDFKPIVQIGRGGLTDAVASAIDTALETHELIKVKLSADASLEGDEIAAGVEQRTGSSVAQVIGHTLLLYRRRAEKPSIVLPKRKERRDN